MKYIVWRTEQECEENGRTQLKYKHLKREEDEQMKGSKSKQTGPSHLANLFRDTRIDKRIPYEVYINVLTAFIRKLRKGDLVL